jgi:hypothetical protein
MKTRLVSIFLIASLAGCNSGSTHKKVSGKLQYDVINTVLNQYVFIPYENDVRPVRYTGCLYQVLPGNDMKDQMKAYVGHAENILTVDDTEYIMWQIDRNWNTKIKPSLIDSYNITVIKDQGRNFERLCDDIVLYLSLPVFTKEKEYAFIWQSMVYKDLQADFVLTLQLQKRRWQLISYEIVDGD